MTDQNHYEKNLNTDVNPYVSGLAVKLMKTAQEAQLKLDSVGWELITEMLSYAAAAEQRLGEQRERIAILEDLSVTDDLTGLPNRRALRSFIARALSGAARHNENGVVGFVDLDGFKAINDTYGHSAGDKILRHLADTLRSAIRPLDMVARLAGDEFVIVLTRCTEEEGTKRLRIIQKIINEQKIVHRRKTIKLKASMGIMPYDATCDASKVMHAADEAMYLDKSRRAGEHLKCAQ